MTKQFYLSQIERLKTRFTPKAFDDEFVKLIFMMVDDLDAEDFAGLVSNFITTRRVYDPPLEVDFREAYLSIQKAKFKAEVAGATRAYQARISTEAKRQNLKAVLKANFGVETVAEAFEVAKLKIQIARANGEPEPEIEYFKNRGES